MNKTRIVELVRQALLAGAVAGISVQAMASDFSGPDKGGNDTAHVPYTPPSNQTSAGGSNSGNYSVNNSSGTANNYNQVNPTNGGLPPSNNGGGAERAPIYRYVPQPRPLLPSR